MANNPARGLTSPMERRVHLKRRPGLPKTREGCVTCKTARVKCDLAKPFCLRCRRLELECHYASKTPVKRKAVAIKPASEAAKTQPKPLLSAAPKSSSFPYKDLVPIPRQRTSLVFADDQEARCFHLFQERTARTLGACYRSVLWNRVIPQACATEPSIRHAVIAIGALDLTKDTAQKSHYEFALRQYSKAIKHMERSLSLGTRDLRSALILCLLTICFESWNGDIQSALAQVRVGLRLVREFEKNRPCPELHADKELLLAFFCLDNDSIMFINEEPIPIDLSTCGKISTSFNNLAEAKMMFEILLRQFSHWIAQAYAWGSRTKELESRATGSRPAPEYSFAEQRQNYLATFRRWNKGFQPLLRERTENHPEHAAAIALQLRFKSTYTCVAADHFQGETVYDAHITDFDEVIDLADKLSLLGTQESPKYSFDGSFIVSVYVSAMKCRDRAMRRNAIRILRSRQLREGTMDSVLRARLIELQMEIEEAGAVGMYIPEEARIRGIKMKCNMEKRKGTMNYLKMAEAGKNVFEPHSLDFTW